MRASLIQAPANPLPAPRTTQEISCSDSRTDAACTARHTVIIALIGGIIGWVIGMVQVLFLGSAQLLYWELMPLIPFGSAWGWAMLGMIVGGSGLFSKKLEPAEEAERPVTDSLKAAA